MYEPDVDTIARRQARRKQLMDYLMPLGFLALWFILQMWVLPRFGVQT